MCRLALPVSVAFFSFLCSGVGGAAMWPLNANSWNMLGGQWARFSPFRNTSMLSEVTSSSKATLISWKVLDLSCRPSGSTCSSC
uniref:Putative secreted protein n=1 Tax=Ixodes ricinus TaxID=34613 RepID=A0A6B0U7V9_IXORI